MPEIYEVRNNDVEEVMNEIPHWITRWGISSIFIIITILMVVATFIEYPDTIEIKGTLNIDTKGSLESELNSGFISSSLAQRDFSKVEIGSKVKIQFLSFSPEKYGELSGTVYSISESVDKQSNGHLVKISIPGNGLTSKNKKINYSDGLSVKGRIILKQSNLLTKLINNIKL